MPKEDKKEKSGTLCREHQKEGKRFYNTSGEVLCKTFIAKHLSHQLLEKFYFQAACQEHIEKELRQLKEELDKSAKGKGEMEKALKAQAEGVKEVVTRVRHCLETIEMTSIGMMKGTSEEATQQTAEMINRLDCSEAEIRSRVDLLDREKAKVQGYDFKQVMQLWTQFQSLNVVTTVPETDQSQVFEDLRKAKEKEGGNLKTLLALEKELTSLTFRLSEGLTLPTLARILNRTRDICTNEGKLDGDAEGRETAALWKEIARLQNENAKIVSELKNERSQRMNLEVIVSELQKGNASAEAAASAERGRGAKLVEDVKAAPKGVATAHRGVEEEEEEGEEKKSGEATALEWIEKSKGNPEWYKKMKDAYEKIHVQKAEEYGLWDNESLGDNGAMMVGALLKRNTTLKKLLLFGWGIREEGGEAIGAALAANQTLEYLYLESFSDRKIEIGLV